MSKNRINQEMVEEVLPTGTTADSNPYDYGKVEAKRTEKNLYTQSELDDAVEAENEGCAKIAYSYFDGIDCAEDIRARIK